MYSKVCTKHFPVVLCTTKFAQSTSKYYFVLQSLHAALTTTTLYYKACKGHVSVLLCTAKLAPMYYKVCTKYFPVLLCTTKFPQSTSQYYFVLLSLHKALPSTTLYYKACKGHVSVLLCTAKLARMYYKACTKRCPVLLCITKLAPVLTLYCAGCTSTSQYIALRINKLLYTASFYTETLLHREAFRQGSIYKQRRFYTQKALHTASFYTEKAFTQRMLFCFTQRSFYTKKAFTHSKLLRREAFTQRKFLQTASF